MVTMTDAIYLAKFIVEANARLNDARAVETGNKEILAEELNDMANQASWFLTEAGVE